MADSDCYSDAEDFPLTTLDNNTTRTMVGASKQPRVLPLDSFYKAVLSDLLLSRNEAFFNFLFSQIFSRKVKANINGKPVSYDELRLHFISLRKTYYSHSADGVLRFGPFLTNSANGDREGYLAAHMVLASLADSSADARAEGLIQYNALLVTDTLEVQWMEGKNGEVRRISRFDRTTRRPVQSP